MILLLDIGNSRVKWAASDGARLRAPQARAHAGSPGRLLQSLDLPRCDAVWVASVTGKVHDRAIAEAIAARCGVRARFARVRGSCAGLRVAYARPRRLGVDRWLAMLAAWLAERKPFCVVTAGTALTYDEVRRGGRHAGGLIAPGLSTALGAVKASTRFPLNGHAAAFAAGLGTDTEACVRQGALFACTGLIERASRDAAGARLITGGDAATLRPHLGGGWSVRPHLVLEGLLAYARLARELRR